MRKDIIEKKDEIIEMISRNEPKISICNFLNCKPVTLNSYLKKLGIEYKGNPGLKGKKNSPNETSYKEYTENGKRISACKLKNKLFKQGVKEKKCELCLRTEWNGKNIPLELHHINCNHYDNSLDNLKILCPNCHAQLQANSHKSIDTSTKECKKQKENKKHFCSRCMSEIKKRTKTGKCRECMIFERRVVDRPSRTELLELIKKNSFVSLGKRFKVSDNAIKKWCKSYGLPYKKEDIKNYQNCTMS